MLPVTNQIRNCPSRKCGYTTNDNVVNCPKCQRRLRPAKEMRRLGWVLASVGLFLVALPGILAVYLAPIKGTWADGTEKLRLFGALILFGLNVAMAGIFQIRTGHRNIWFLIVGVVLLVVVLFEGGIYMLSEFQM